MFAHLNIILYSRVLLLIIVSAQDNIVNVPFQIPSGASQIIDHAFPSLGFETSSFWAFTGTVSSPNMFSRNLVGAIGQKTGKAPFARVGGTSGDFALYDASQTQPVTINPSQQGKNVPINITIGPSYFTQSFSNFPGSKYTYAVPMIPRIDQSIEWARLALNAIGDNLESLEVGNEPNFYGKSNKPSPWNPTTYSQQWLQYTDAISGNFTLPQAVYQGFVIGDPQGSEWTTRKLFEDGIDKAAKTLQSVSYHYYQTTADPSNPVQLQDVLMNHTAIKDKLNTFSADIDYLKENHPSITFVLGEVGSALNPNGIDTHPQDPGLEAVLGSALWTLDFMLYAMSINITRVSMQQGLGFGYAAWQPVVNAGLQPAVKAPYYGYVFAADFIGTNQHVRIKNLDLDLPELAGYAAYDSGSLARIALVNLNAWNVTGTGVPVPRPAKNFSLMLSASVKQVRVDLLTGLGASAMAEDGITWAGMSWTFANRGVGKQVVQDSKTLDVTGGAVTVTVQASEAIMVTIL